jgi:MoaA/NifB/PqqE/SkfB family radical SAM enzyme
MVDVSLKPGRHKLIHHLGHLQKMRAGEVVAPIHVSVWPTLRCQSKCSYCCCRNENHSTSFQDLSWQDFIVAVDTLSKYGTKALEFSGGGEPLLWPHFSDGVIYARNHGLKLSLITNGYALPEISKDVLGKFEWIRVSFQSVQHAQAVDFSCIPKGTKFSASYILDGVGMVEDLRPLHDFVKDKGIITRIAVAQPSAAAADEVGEDAVRRFGEPFFFSQKERGGPLGCYMAWVRAAIDWKGNFLPCPAVMLATGNGRVEPEFQLCHVSDLEEWLLNNRPKDLGFRCAFCNCGKEYNDLICSLINGVDDADFV